MRTSGMGMDLPVTTESSDRSSIAIRQGGDKTSDTWATNGDMFLLVEGCFWGGVQKGAIAYWNLRIGREEELTE